MQTQGGVTTTVNEAPRERKRSLGNEENEDDDEKNERFRRELGGNLSDEEAFGRRKDWTARRSRVTASLHVKNTIHARET